MTRPLTESLAREILEDERVCCQCDELCEDAQFSRQADEYFCCLCIRRCSPIAVELCARCQDRDIPLTCEQCGNHVESLREAYSEDRSVGYSEGRWMCASCRGEE